MLALALTLALLAQPCAGMGAADRFADCTLFQSPQEAANFSAHAAWSLAFPLAGHALDGKRGAMISGGTWMAYSLVNEVALHGPESERERNLNLLSRLVPCAVVMLIAALAKP